MTLFDFSILALIALSVLFAFARGVVREIVALAAWIVGFVAALRYSGPGSELFAGLAIAPAARHVLAFVLILLVVLIVGALVAWLVKSAVRAVGLGFVDRLLGAVFGLARGVILAMVFALIAGLTALPRNDWWQNSIFGPLLSESAMELRPYLPPEWAARLDFSAPGKPGGAGAASARLAPDGETEPCVES
jgi:membrane protein required for colicin V production